MCEFSKAQSWQADHLAYIGEQSHIRFEGQQEGLVQGKKEGIAEGEERKLVQNLRTVMRKSNMTTNEAMNFLDVPETDRPRLKKMLEPEKV